MSPETWQHVIELNRGEIKKLNRDIEVYTDLVQSSLFGTDDDYKRMLKLAKRKHKKLIKFQQEMRTAHKRQLKKRGVMI